MPLILSPKVKNTIFFYTQVFEKCTNFISIETFYTWHSRKLQMKWFIHLPNPFDWWKFFRQVSLLQKIIYIWLRKVRIVFEKKFFIIFSWHVYFEHVYFCSWLIFSAAKQLGYLRYGTAIMDAVDSTTLEKLENAFEKLQKSDSKSLLKKYLTAEVFESLKTKKTSYGSTLLDCIQSGIPNYSLIYSLIFSS